MASPLKSLARRVGMVTTSNPTILTGAELDAMDDLNLKQLLDKEVIFARMAPTTNCAWFLLINPVARWLL